MDYFSILQLNKEPFANTPDPDAFFESRQHLGCLQKLELAVRLKRGLNVVIGDVGTGKTTLCRELIRRLDEDPQVEAHLILDPAFDTAADFLELAHAMLCEGANEAAVGERRMKEHLKQALFEKGVTQERTVVLIIDEGQKLQAAVVEILRELLNYETNQFKLLQIVIFAQGEFEEVLHNRPNFADRINLLQYLTPLGFGDTRRLIRYRIRRAAGTAGPKPLFTLPAMWAIYRATRGYPRKIIHLCHHSTLALIIQNRTRAGWRLVRACGRRMPMEPGAGSRRPRRRIAVALPVTVVFLVAMVAVMPGRLFDSHDPPPHSIAAESVAHQPEAIPPADASTAEKVPTPAPSAMPPAAAAHFAPVETALTQEKPAGEDPPADSQSAQNPEPATANAFPNSEYTVPRILGQVAVRPGDTLFALVQSVYGSSATRFTRAVIDANPQLKNPNAIDLNDVIAFPAIPLMPPGGPERHWLYLESHDTLAESLKRREDLRREAAEPLRIIAQWSAAEGLRFRIAIDRLFGSHHAAAKHVATLPEHIAPTVRIQSGWPEGTRIFSLPIRSLQDG